MTFRFKNAVDFQQRFWSQVNIVGPNECWIWQGRKTKAGYGNIPLHRTSSTAHRVAYEIVHGIEVPSDVYVCHRCDNPPCCNPSHLFKGTAFDNQADSMAKGRRISSFPLTSNSPSHCRLTWDDVVAIRLATDNLPRGRFGDGSYHPKQHAYESLAVKYGVSVRCIEKVATRKTWTDNSREYFTARYTETLAAALVKQSQDELRST